MRTKSPDVANCLLDNGADIERKADDGSFALALASTDGSLAVLKVLLTRGALGQILKVSRIHTPLRAAAISGNEDIILLLLQHLVLQPGFNIDDIRLAASEPLLCYAAIFEHCRVAEFALDHGADVNITGLNGPPLILAINAGHNSLVNLLCERGANVQACFGTMNCLERGLSRGDAEIVSTLIRYGVDVNAVADSKHTSAVVQAAVSGKCDIVQLLLDAGATLDTEQQYQAVGHCCSMLDEALAVKVVKLLLPHCSRIADNNYEVGANMLSQVVYQGKLHVAQLLHAAGADVHRTVQNGTLITTQLNQAT
jgi:ankyrin repeat domain-containing protein 50